MATFCNRKYTPKFWVILSFLVWNERFFEVIFPKNPEHNLTWPLPPQACYRGKCKFFFFRVFGFLSRGVQMPWLRTFRVFLSGTHFWSKSEKLAKIVFFGIFGFFVNFVKIPRLLTFCTFFRNLQKYILCKIGQNWSPGEVGKNDQKIIDWGQTDQNWEVPSGDPGQVPDPVFGKMGKIIFCKFCLNTAILNIFHFFRNFRKSILVKIDQNVPRGQLVKMYKK